MNTITNLHQDQNKVIVSMGYDHIETNITLTSGHGTILPDPFVVGPYNIVWWNVSDYEIPTNDPFVEVVRCIAKMNDTLIVMRSQQQTLVSPKNIFGKLYNMTPLPYNNLEALSYYNLPQQHGASSHTGTIGDHANLSSIGSNTHTQIDTAISTSTGHIAASGTSVHGLSTMSIQSASSVAITGGSITGITDLAVPYGGTGRSDSVAYAPICGGTTSTGAYQSVASIGTTGQVLTSNGTDTLPSFQTPSSVPITGITASRISRDYGYAAGGNGPSAVTEKYDDVSNTWAAKTNINTAREMLAGFSLNGYGYTAGGSVITSSSSTEKYDDISNAWTNKANLNISRYNLAGFSLNGYGYTTAGYLDTYANSATTEKYDDAANTWTTKANLIAKFGPAGFSLNGYGYTSGGFVSDYSTVVEKYDDVSNTWAAKGNMNTARYGFAGFSLNGYGYTAGGYTGTGITAVTEKYDDIANTWTIKAYLNTAKRYPAGFLLNGYGYTTGGYVAAPSSATEKYDDVANTWTTKANLNTSRSGLAGFSLGAIQAGVQNPEITNIYKIIKDGRTPEKGVTGSRISRDYGYTAGGIGSAVTEKYDDILNTWTAKANLNTARGALAGFSLNGYGYTAGGTTGVDSAVTEKYDDVANTWVPKGNMNTARSYLAGFSLNGYGYSVGGNTNGTVAEKYDDVSNTWVTKAALNTARYGPAGFSPSGYGYIVGGSNAEKYDDLANTWTVKTSMNTARVYLAGFSLNGYGYCAGGDISGAPSAVTEKYDDVANTWTTKAILNTARNFLAGFSLNGYGYTAGGMASAVTEKYDDVANIWTAKASMNTGRTIMACFSLGAIQTGVQNPEIIPIYKAINRNRPSKVTLTPGTTVSVNTAIGNIFTLTPAQAEAITPTGQIPCQTIVIVITTSGATSYVLTFGAGFKSIGTLTTGATSGKIFTITFVSDGTNYNEIARTAAM